MPDITRIFPEKSNIALWITAEFNKHSQQKIKNNFSHKRLERGCLYGKIFKKQTKFFMKQCSAKLI